jgi:hypothetical protein
MLNNSVSRISLRFVSYGIGSAGEAVGCIPKRVPPTGDSLLSYIYTKPITCENDLDLIKTYATNYNTWIGSINGASAFGIRKSTVLGQIDDALQFAKDRKSSLVLYYTGHGEQDTGNWCFANNDTIALDEIALMVVREKVKTYVVSDCPYSGAWAVATTKVDTDLIRVISSSGPDETTVAGAFADAFWGGQGFSRALAPAPMLGPISNSPGGMRETAQLTGGNLSRLWFVDFERHNTSFWNATHDWRPRSGNLTAEAAQVGGGLVFCAAAWDMTAALGNPFAVPGVTDNAVCMGVVGLAAAARRYISGPLPDLKK